MQINAAGLQPSRDMEQTVSRAFRTAHLLTASIRQAESAVLEAIDSFDPDVDTAQSLFQNAILAANDEDMKAAGARNLSPALMDRLKLDAKRGPVEVVVIDHVEKTPTEN